MPEQDQELDDQLALTAGEQDHTDPWVFAGDEADAPTDTGRPADE